MKRGEKALGCRTGSNDGSESTELILGRDAGTAVPQDGRYTVAFTVWSWTACRGTGLHLHLGGKVPM